VKQDYLIPHHAHTYVIVVLGGSPAPRPQASHNADLALSVVEVVRQVPDEQQGGR
jgi:hypothetical protein